jgi:release factor glutamine methyltransferase
MENSDWPSSPFDMVVSNPPYIPNIERHTLAPDVVNQEPEMALFVPDADPLLFYRRIVEGCCQEGWLRSEGWLGFECHRDFTEEVCALFKDAYWRDVDRRKDLNGNWRMVFARLR